MFFNVGKNLHGCISCYKIIIALNAIYAFEQLNVTLQIVILFYKKVGIFKQLKF